MSAEGLERAGFLSGKTTIADSACKESCAGGEIPLFVGEAGRILEWV